MVIEGGTAATADEVMNAMGSIFNDVAQNIFDADYNGFDPRLANSGTPNLKNMGYDVFTSDTATTTTNFTYDSTNDLYLGDTAATTATLIVPLDTATSTITNAISIVNDKNLKSFQDNILEASFETDVNWTFSETAAGWTGGVVADPKTGTNAYRFSKSATNLNGTEAQIQQTGIDLTNVDRIGLWLKDTSGGANYRYQVLIDSTIVINLLDTGGPTSTYKFFTASIPGGLQATGKSITIKILGVGPDSDVESVTFDDINIWSTTTEDTRTYEYSADGGSNFESVTLSEVVRPSNTGTAPQLKIIHTQAAGTFTGTDDINTVSELASKHNFY